MAHSIKPSAWIEKRRTSRRYSTFHVRAERDGVRFPSLDCGTDGAFATKVRDDLRRALVQRAPAVEALVAELRAGAVARGVFAADLMTYLAEGRAPERHWAPLGRTLGELVDEYLREARKYKRPRAVEIDERAAARLVAFLGREKALDAVTSKEIRVFHAQMVGKAQKPGAPPRPLSKTSEAIYLFALRAMFNRARGSYKWMTHDPFDGVNVFRVGSKGRLIHEDEFHRVQGPAQAVVRGGRSLWDALNVMRHQGIRTGAVEALDGRMVNRATRHLHLIKPARLGIQREAELKDTELYAPIHRAVWPIFAAAPTAGRLFEGWRRGEIAKELRRICDGLGMPRFRPHDLKHTFVTNFLKGGGTLAMCSAITGTSVAMLKRVYGHLEGRVPPSEMDRVSYSSPTTPQKSKAARA